MAGIGIVKSNFDDSIYPRLEKDDGETITVKNVDKILILGRYESKLHNVASPIEKHVYLRVEPSVTKLLGTTVNCNEEAVTLTISNAPVIDGSLRHFGLADYILKLTPISSGIKIDLDESENP